ncbi:MAG TPA: hypothetical protein VGP46_12315 [Acidimicrobiales bacterium]|nr:hypothetical protein [Acidimicrobiales bacterium]
MNDSVPGEIQLFHLGAAVWTSPVAPVHFLPQIYSESPEVLAQSGRRGISAVELPSESDSSCEQLGAPCIVRVRPLGDRQCDLVVKVLAESLKFGGQNYQQGSVELVRGPAPSATLASRAVVGSQLVEVFAALALPTN